MSAATLIRQRARGFTIVEVLVALVVLCVGMLGIAALYVTTLRSSGSAISRMQAVNLASDIADRIRANRRGRETYEMTGTPADRDCIGESANCSAAEMAENDLFWWKQQITDSLPGNPTGRVLVEGTNPRRYVIRIEWEEPGEAERLFYVLRMQQL